MSELFTRGRSCRQACGPDFHTFDCPNNRPDAQSERSPKCPRCAALLADVERLERELQQADGMLKAAQDMGRDYWQQVEALTAQNARLREADL